MSNCSENGSFKKIRRLLGIQINCFILWFRISINSCKNSMEIVVINKK